MTNPTPIAQAEALYRAGAYADAAAIVSAIDPHAPSYPIAVRILGLCQLRLGDPTQALATLRRARDLAPNDPLAHLHYGLGLYTVGRHAEAAAIFRVCQRLIPNDHAASLNLAAAALALGDHREAIRAARKATLRAPRDPRARYMLGTARMAANQLQAAEQAFQAALRLDPNFADAWVNLGFARYRQSNMEGAKAALRRALAADPANRAAISNLGALARLTGDADGAETLLRGALSRDPDSTEARVNLAAHLLQDERPAEALAELDAAAEPAEPRLALHLRSQRALALLHLNRPREARAILDAIGDGTAEAAPQLLWRRVLLASAEGDRAAARDLAQRMDAALTAQLLPEHAIMAHFDLAKFWSRERQPDQAFPHWVAGHRLLGRFQPFSRAAWTDYLDATIARFDRARLHDGPRAGNRDAAPVFIVGMPRSGTTLAEQIIAAHPAAYGAGERGALGSAFRTYGGADTRAAVQRVAALDTPALDRAADAYLAELHALDPAAQRIVDKMPGNFAWLGLAALMLPGARVIHCTRDPRDIGLSIFTFRFHGHHPYAHDLSDLGWYIAQQERVMAHWRAVLPNPVLTLALRDWVDDFDATLRRVLDFLDLPYDAACARFYENDGAVRTVSRSQVRQPVNARGLGRWREYEQHLRPLIEALETERAAAGNIGPLPE